MDRQNKDKAPAYVRGAINPLAVWCMVGVWLGLKVSNYKMSLEAKQIIQTWYRWSFHWGIHMCISWMHILMAWAPTVWDGFLAMTAHCASLCLSRKQVALLLCLGIPPVLMLECTKHIFFKCGLHALMASKSLVPMFGFMKFHWHVLHCPASSQSEDPCLWFCSGVFIATAGLARAWMGKLTEQCILLLW